jgi:hypothetical protein
MKERTMWALISASPSPSFGKFQTNNGPYSIPNSVTPRTFEDRAESPRTRSVVLFMSQATSLAPQDAEPRLFEHGTVLFQGSNYHVRHACERVVCECMYAISLSTLIRGSTLYVCRGGNKDIVRILFMVPIYAITSFGSYVFGVCLSLSLYL